MTSCALIIGINTYEYLPKEKHLKFAVRDAEAIRDFLQDVVKLPAENIILCTDDSPLVVEGIETRPTARNLLTILRYKIPRNVDNFWLYFTGHGINDNHKDYLLPSNGETNHPESLVSTNFIVEQLRDIHKAKNIVLILDMCREFAILPEGSRSTGIFGEETAKLAREKGIVTIFACQRGEKSYEIGDDIKHGAFTYCLLQGLRQHEILKNLDEYLAEEVPKLTTQRVERYQRPLIIPEPAVKYEQPLFISHDPQAKIDSLKSQAIDLELAAKNIEDFKKAKALWQEISDLSDNLEISVVDGRKIRAKAKDVIRRIEGKIDEIIERITSGNQSTSKVEEPPTRVVVPIPIVQPAKPVEEVKLRLPSYSFSVITLDRTGKKIDERSGRAEYFAEKLGDGIELEMVNISGGEFWMGTTDQEAEEYIKNAVSYGVKEADARSYVNCEKPRHRVKVPDFSMGKCLVTQAQWKQVAAMKKVKIDLKPEPANFKGEKLLPVDSVNWYQAVEFCQRLSKHTGNAYRLPSEAQWEYACRSRTETPFHFGATITPEYVNYNGNYSYSQAAKGEYRSKTTPVGSFPPNGFGLYDMHGNLWEWCEDDWQDNYQDSPKDGKARIDNNNHSQNKTLIKVLRGGSWNDHARNCRSGNRLRVNAEYDLNSYGFRVACLPFLPRTP